MIGEVAKQSYNIKEIKPVSWLKYKKKKDQTLKRGGGISVPQDDNNTLPWIKKEKKKKQFQTFLTTRANISACFYWLTALWGL